MKSPINAVRSSVEVLIVAFLDCARGLRSNLRCLVR